MIVEKVAEALDLDLDKLDTVEVRGFDGRVVGNSGSPRLMGQGP